MAVPKHLGVPVLFVAFLLTVAGIGVHAREESLRGKNEPAPVPRELEPAATTVLAQAPPLPSPAARAPEILAMVPTGGPASPAAAPAVALDEPALMKQLREMRQSDPELSLRLAREGNDRYPASPDAPERASIVVKSLMRMGRGDEARAEARAMVEQYPGTPWALDVKRHMLDIPSYNPDPAGR